MTRTQALRMAKANKARKRAASLGIVNAPGSRSLDKREKMQAFRDIVRETTRKWPGFAEYFQ